MKAYNGYKAERYTSSEPLPAGGYVVKILKAETTFTKTGSEQLTLSLDVAEGNKKGFFEEQYRANPNDDKKWKGVYRQFVPTGDGSDGDSKTVRAMNNLIACIEESNPGYHWDWNEGGLKGKLLGGLWRNKEYEVDGRRGWTTEMAGVTTAQDIREGKFKPLADKPLTTSHAASFGTAADTPRGGGSFMSNGRTYAPSKAEEDELADLFG